jgi:hypothetical protein
MYSEKYYLFPGIVLEQGSPNYARGPHPARDVILSGPRYDFIRPANELCRNAPIELIFQRVLVKKKIKIVFKIH